MALAIGADAAQLLLVPLFSEGALSPIDDVLRKSKQNAVTDEQAGSKARVIEGEFRPS